MHEGILIEFDALASVRRSSTRGRRSSTTSGTSARRLTRLYEAMDYPADEKTAHEVASRLLVALEQN